MSNTCAPHREFDFTCYTKDALIDLIKKINDIRSASLPTSGTKRELWNALTQELRTICGASRNLDQCIAQSANMDKSFMNDYFKPPKPKGKYTWLSNFEIMDVMSGYQKKFPQFRAFGPVPSDFPSLRTDLTGIQLKDLYNRDKITKISLIANTAPSGTSGEHWVSMFVDLDGNSIEYFDSVGDPPFKEMKKYMNQLKTYCKINFDKKMKIKINNTEFQVKSPGDCGIWAIDYPVARLNNKTFEDYVRLNKSESAINKCRDYYFAGGKTKTKRKN